MLETIGVVCWRLFCVGIGYLFGLFQTGYLIGKLHRTDIRNQGSKNAGTTNVLRTLGWRAGVLTFLGDLLKCVGAVLVMEGLARLLSGGVPVLAVFLAEQRDLLVLYTGLGVTLGHNFPFYMGFRGGKGIAVMTGCVLCLQPLYLPIPFVIFLVAVWLTGYVSLGSLLATAIFLPEALLAHVSGEELVLIFLLVALAWFQHRGNIQRLLSGTENSFRRKHEKRKS